MATVSWALALDVGAALAVFVVASLAVSIAATRRRAFEWEYAFAVALVAVAITEFVRRFVLPSLAFGDVDAAVAAIPFGVVMALMWSGWRVRQRRRDRPADTALALLSGGSTAARPDRCCSWPSCRRRPPSRFDSSSRWIGR